MFALLWECGGQEEVVEMTIEGRPTALMTMTATTKDIRTEAYDNSGARAEAKRKRTLMRELVASERSRVVGGSYL